MAILILMVSKKHIQIQSLHLEVILNAFFNVLNFFLNQTIIYILKAFIGDLRADFNDSLMNKCNRELCTEARRRDWSEETNYVFIVQEKEYRKSDEPKAKKKKLKKIN